jgi:hypothetical protein
MVKLVQFKIFIRPRQYKWSRKCFDIFKYDIHRYNIIENKATQDSLCHPINADHTGQI